MDSAFGVGQKGWHSSFPLDVSQVDHPNGHGFHAPLSHLQMMG
jgi:hypothetical protein